MSGNRELARKNSCHRRVNDTKSGELGWSENGKTEQTRAPKTSGQRIPQFREVFTILESFSQKLARILAVVASLDLAAYLQF
jgi:hypothetical protein